MAGRIKKRKTLSYAKWGYIFILPFFITYAIFQLYPIITTFVYAFQDVQYKAGVTINEGWNNFANFAYLFKRNRWLEYFGNTMLIQFMGFIPQMIVSLILAVWFTDSRLKIRGAGFFKAVIYMPNLIMATAMAQLFSAMFQRIGPLGQLFFPNSYALQDVWACRWIVAFINFTMWFGNTTILLMAGVMGIDDSIFEAATIDGAGPIRTFKDITMPLLMPIFIYVFLTSLIGGIQMFDIPQNLIPKDNGKGGGQHQIKTVIMYLNDFLGATNKNYGRAGALSLLLFLLTAVLSFIVFKTTSTDMAAARAKRKARKAKKVNA
jgi:multiple sugar transport system permease protein